MGLDMYLSEHVIEKAGYWRKANAIHGWFVDNVQDGNDDCKEYYVPREKLKELFGLVTLVLENPKMAKKLLPVREGFFFGNYDPSEGYDDYYFECLESTKEILKFAIENEYGDFYYHSSW